MGNHSITSGQKGFGVEASSFQDRVSEFCTHHPVGFRVITQIAIIGGTSLTTLSATQPWGGPIWGTLGIVVLLSSLWIREGVGYQHSMIRTEPARKKNAWGLLNLACPAMVPATIPRDLAQGTKVIRACVMRPAPGNNLRIWVPYAMDGDPDNELSIEDHSGLAGHVYKNANAPVFHDRMAQPDHPFSSVRPNHADTGIRKAMRSMLCVPIFDPYDDVGQRDKLGVVCFDSDLAVEEIGFGTVDASRMATGVADLLAIALRQEGA